jgi:hypothetical protein
MFFAARRQCLSTSVRLLLLLKLGACATLLCSAQTIEIKLIDGRNGHPVAGSCLNVWIGNERKDALAIPTDTNGVARLRLTNDNAEVNTGQSWKACGELGVVNPVVKYEDSVAINVGYVLCRPRGADSSWLSVNRIPTQQLLKQGVVTANTCGKPMASPKPGELVLFVRPLTFWEKFKT